MTDKQITKRLKKTPKTKSQRMGAKATLGSATNRKKRAKKKQKVIPTPRWKRGISLAFDILFYVSMMVILLGTTLFVANQDPEKSFFGYRFYSVKTNSMVPQKDSLPGGFYAGDITIVKMASLDQIKAKDIITYRVGENAYLTHRLVKKENTLNGEEGPFLITKGDANNSEDPPIKGDRLVGKVLFVIPKVGGVLTFIRTHFVVSIVFLLSMFGFVWIIRLYLEQPREYRSESLRKRKSRSSV